MLDDRDPLLIRSADALIDSCQLRQYRSSDRFWLLLNKDPDRATNGLDSISVFDRPARGYLTHPIHPNGVIHDLSMESQSVLGLSITSITVHREDENPSTLLERNES